MMSNTSNHTDF